MMRDPDLALETHAREELGFTPGETGNPLQAAASSFVMFALGAFIPLLPWLFTERHDGHAVVGRPRCRGLAGRRRRPVALHRAVVAVVGRPASC